MKVSDNKVVSLTYELRADDPNGEVVDKADSNSPFSFLYGAGNVLPEFENNLEGLGIGDSFDFKLKDEDAYGAVNENAVVDLPKETFVVDGQLREDLLEVGNVVPMKDQQGNALQGRVVDVADKTVKLDFNHPLAGKNLHFKGEVVDLREATQEELEHKHVHGPGGHQH